MTNEEAFFKVEERDMYFPIEKGKRRLYEKTEGYKGIINADKDQLISVVSKNYTLIKHVEVVRMVRKVLSNYRVEENIRVAQEGAQMFARFALDNDKSELRRGDIIKPIIEVSNCYDMTFRLGFELCAERLVCTNGMRLPIKISKVARKHIGTVAEDFTKSLAEVVNKWKDALGIWRSWSTLKVEPATGYAVIESIDGLPKKFRRQVTERWMSEPGDSTIYDLYNHLTWVTSHTLETTVDRQRELEIVSSKQFEEALRKQAVIA